MYRPSYFDFFRRFHFPVLMILAPMLTGCVLLEEGGADSVAFTGRTVGCGNYHVSRESADGYWILSISESVAFSGDTVYERNLQDTTNLIAQIERYDQAHQIAVLHCNDYGVDVELLETRKATQGLLRVKAYNVVLDSSYAPLILRNFRMDLELENVKFEGGTEIRELHIDSVHAGWLPG
jgi:hypothetical protein